MLSLKVQRTACLAGSRIVFRGTANTDKGTNWSGVAGTALRCFALDSESDGGQSAKSAISNAQMSVKTNNRMIEAFTSREHEFSPSRDRETVSAVIEEVHGESFTETQGSEGSQYDMEKTEFEKSTEDHTQKYDMKSTVSLHSVMYGNVPTPYGGKPNHLNMPGHGDQSRGQKYLSGNLQGTHPTRKFSTTTTFLSDAPAQGDKTDVKAERAGCGGTADQDGSRADHPGV